jgi:hypothetical protein
MNWQYKHEPGVVREITDGGEAEIAIEAEPSESCGSCCACSAYTQGDFRLRVPNRGWEVGQKVVVKVPLVPKWVSVVLLVVAPLAAFVAGALVGPLLPIEGVERSVLSVLGAIAGLILAAIVAIVVNGRITTLHPIEVETDRPGQDEAARGPAAE